MATKVETYNETVKVEKTRTVICCDRCGKDIFERKHKYANRTILRLTGILDVEMVGLGGDAGGYTKPYSLDLCNDCTEAFLQFMKN